MLFHPPFLKIFVYCTSPQNSWKSSSLAESCSLSVYTFQPMSVCVFLYFYLQLNRSEGQCSLWGVNTITITASCCCAGAEEAGHGGGVGVGGMREPARADRERGKLWHDSDKLPCIYSNDVMWSFGCVVMCVFSVWPRWWVNTNELVKRRRRGELQTMLDWQEQYSNRLTYKHWYEKQMSYKSVNLIISIYYIVVNINTYWLSY